MGCCVYNKIIVDLGFLVISKIMKYQLSPSSKADITCFSHGHSWYRLYDVLTFFFLYFIYLFHLRSYLQCSLTNTYTHNTKWTSLQIRRILSFTVKTTHYYIIIALVCNVLAPFLKMDGQLITRFGNHHFKLVNHLNLSV